MQTRSSTNSENTINGKKMYNRTLNVFLSASSYIYLIQSSADGEHWKTDGMGKAKEEVGRNYFFRRLMKMFLLL